MSGTVVRKLMTVGATWLVSQGVLAPGDQSQFTQIMSGVALGIAALAWDWWKNKGHAKLQAQVAKIGGGK